MPWNRPGDEPWWRSGGRTPDPPERVAPLGRNAAELNLPHEVRRHLLGHPSEYELITDRERLCYVESGEHVALFLKERRRWQPVSALRGHFRDEEFLALRRRKPRAAATTGPARIFTFHELSPPPEPYFSTDPTVHIIGPRGRIALDDTRHSVAHFEQHTFAEGDTVESVTRAHLGYAAPEAIYEYNDRCSRASPPQPGRTVRVAVGRDLCVEGTAAHTDFVHLSWSGPTSGAQSVGVRRTPGSSNPDDWRVRFRAKPGEYLLTASVGSASSQATVIIEPADEILTELLLVPETGMCYGLTRADEAALDEDEAEFNALVEDLHRAQQAEDAEQVAQAKQALDEKLAPLLSGGPAAADLTEIIRLRGRKYTYIRSDKMRNHWRSYKLDADDRRRRRLHDNTGALDLKRIRTQMARADGGVHYRWGPSEPMLNDSLTAWARRISQDLNAQSEGAQDADRDYDWSAGARLLRYTAGASLEARFQPHKLQMGLKGQLSGRMALAEGKVGAQGYYPDARGHRPRFVPPGLSPAQAVDLGPLRARLEAQLTGFAGASALVCADIEFKPERDKLKARGVNPGGGASASAFAGARAECDFRGHMEWQNPDAAGQDFKAFASAGYGAYFAGGAGAEAGFRVTFQEGRFFIRANAGLVCGAGAGGRIDYAVDAAYIWEFVMFMRHRLLDVRNDYALLIETRAYEYLCAGLAWYANRKGDDLERIFQEADEVFRWWEFQPYRLDDALAILGRLDSDSRIADYVPPTVRGRLAETLRRAMEEAGRQGQEALMRRLERGMMRLLEKVQDRLDERFTLGAMTLDGSTIDPAQGEMKLAALDPGGFPRVGQWLAMRHTTLPAYAGLNAPIRTHSTA
jgi:hypothetical protein